MTTQRQIDVIVAPDGGIKIDAVGFTGTDCEQATAFLEKALGAISVKRKKPEYYQCNTVKNQQRVGG